VPPCQVANLLAVASHVVTVL